MLQFNERLIEPDLKVGWRADPGDGDGGVIEQPLAEGLLSRGMFYRLTDRRSRSALFASHEDQSRESQLPPPDWRAVLESDNGNVDGRVSDHRLAIICRFIVPRCEIGHVGHGVTGPEHW